MTKTLAAWRKSMPPKPVSPELLVEEVYQHVGRICSEQRKRLGMSQSAFGRKIGRSAPFVSRVEAGIARVQLHELPVMAKALKIRVIDLLPVEYSKGFSS